MLTLGIAAVSLALVAAVFPLGVSDESGPWADGLQGDVGDERAPPTSHSRDTGEGGTAEGMRLSASGSSFLSTAEVDQPARPARMWSIDTSGLQALGVRRVVFDVGVDAAARIVQLKVVSVEPAEASGLSMLLEAQLAKTAMVAAHRQGTAVPHEQRIELGVD